ncbi:hypothetical protein RRG08_050359 [Elysia crispata]|uniref:Reverse transcriptase domain-containing protein n=1 Tax=Elysia crispata TaxID=231223 RepID=A0AAE1CLL5_9GAST|nr:hypothetical protein RRG08_050359 [Elysia crispata]
MREPKQPSPKNSVKSIWCSRTSLPRRTAGHCRVTSSELRPSNHFFAGSSSPESIGFYICHMSFRPRGSKDQDTVTQSNSQLALDASYEYAAFDTIDHDILLARAHSPFGIDGKALYWLNAYLKNRTQTVSIDNNKATPSPLKYGVPQGSVLGPLLFTMYTAPVADIAKRHGVNYHLNADDTQLYVPLDNTLETASYQKESIEKCVVEIADWMNSNKLKLNSDKTDVIVFGTNKALIDLNFNSVQIKKFQRSCFKFSKESGMLFRRKFYYVLSDQ